MIPLSRSDTTYEQVQVLACSSVLKKKTPENTSYVELRVSQLFYVKLPFLRSKMNVHQIIKYLEKNSCTVPHGQQSVGQCIQGLLDTIKTMFIIHA